MPTSCREKKQKKKTETDSWKTNAVGRGGAPGRPEEFLSGRRWEDMRGGGEGARLSETEKDENEDAGKDGRLPAATSGSAAERVKVAAGLCVGWGGVLG